MKKAFFRKKGIENSITLYILLFLACLNFIGRGPILFLLFCIWGLIKSIDVHIKWNVNAICYLLMSLAAIIASILFFDGKEIIKSFVYFLAFVVGYKGYLSSNNKNQFVKYSIFAAFAGFFCNVLITYYINFIVIGHTSGQRQLYSFWTNDLMSVTLIGLMSSVLIAYSFYCIFCKQSVLYKVLGCIIVGLLSFVNLETSTRTPFVLIGIVYVFMLYELFRSNGTKHKGQLLVILSFFAFIIINKVLPNIKDSALAERFNDEGMNTSRLDITIKYINEMLNYPFGGSEIANKTHLLAHNFLLEAYDMYGILFLVPMILIFFLMVYRFYNLHRIKHKNDVTFLLLAMFLSVSIQIMLEPVIGGYPQLVWFLFLVDGMTIPYLGYTHKKTYA